MLVSVEAIVTVSLDAFVVSVTLEPAAKVRVSAAPSATTSSCPLTDIVLNASLAPDDAAAAIVTAPPDSVIVTLLPAVKARVSFEARVLPPAVTGLKVLVSDTELVIVTAPPLSEIVIPVPAVNAKVSPFANVLPPAVTVLGAVR